MSCVIRGSPNDALAIEPTSTTVGDPVQLTITGRFPASVRVSYREPSGSSVSTAYAGSLGGLALEDLSWQGVDGLSILEEMKRGVDVGTCVSARHYSHY